MALVRHGGDVARPEQQPYEQGEQKRRESQHDQQDAQRPEESRRTDAEWRLRWVVERVGHELILPSSLALVHAGSNADVEEQARCRTFLIHARP